jgi:putative MATE family efflux protein
MNQKPDKLLKQTEHNFINCWHICTAMHTRKDILGLAWPAIVDNFLHTLTHTVDMIMVGRLGASYLASVGLGGQVLFIFQSLMIAVTVGTVAMVARSIGEQNEAKARNVLEQCLFFGALTAFVATPFLSFYAGDFLHIYRAEEEVLTIASHYLKIAVFGTAFIFVCLASAQALRGAGDTKTPLVISSIINGTNVGLNYILIFGKLGFPPLGVRGAAIGTTLAFVLGSVLYIVLLWRKKLRLHISFRGFSPDLMVVRKILAIGTPAAAEQLVIQMGFLVYTVIITSFGTESIAAHHIGIRIQSFSFMPGLGFAIAATALVGQNLGAKKPREAEKSGWEACRMAILLMVGVAAFIFIFAENIAQIFVTEENVIERAVIFIRILAFGEPAIAIHFTIGGALRGAGDTKWPLYASTVGLYGFRIPLALFLSYTVGIGVIGAWIAMTVEYFVRSFFVSLRFRRGGWKTIEVF